MWQFKLFAFLTSAQSRTICKQFWNKVIYKIWKNKRKDNSRQWHWKQGKRTREQPKARHASLPALQDSLILFASHLTGLTWHKEKMRTVTPVFWHCNSTESKRQSENDNSAAELGTLVPAFTLPPCKHFHIMFFLLCGKKNEQQWTICNSVTKYFLHYWKV